MSKSALGRIAFATALVITLGSLHEARAAADVEGAFDHPLVERMAGSFIRDLRHEDFRSVTLPAGQWDRRERSFLDSVTLEGEWRKLVYGFADNTSTLRVHRSFLQILPAAGFELIYAGADAELVAGGVGRSSDFLTGMPEYDLTRRGPLEVRQPVYYLLARHQTQPVHVAIATYRAAGNLGGTEYTVTVVTEEEMVVAMDHKPLSANEMEQGLISEGRVAIQDILFAFDSDEILPESASALATIAELMDSRVELGLLVVGHTDDVGDFDYNLRLSMTRATAVAEFLQREHGIAASRLRSAGAGMMAPMASNRGDEGRARNRRVELVEIRD